MKKGRFFQVIFYGLLGLLYLASSVYAVSCAFHHDPLRAMPYPHSHGDDHGPQKGPDSGEDLFCKFAQNVGGAAATDSQVSLSGFEAAFSPSVEEGLSPHGVVEETHPPRAPPFLLS